MKKLLALLLCVFAFSANAQENTFFGITLGKPMPYPECTTIVGLADDAICFTSGTENGMTLHFGASVLPRGIKNGISISTIDGNVEYIFCFVNSYEGYFRIIENRLGSPTKQGNNSKSAMWDLNDGAKAVLADDGKVVILIISSKKEIDIIAERNNSRVQF